MIRRLLIAALLSAPLAACQTAQQPSRVGRRTMPAGISAPSRTSRTTSRWSTAAGWTPKYARQTVDYKGPEKPGSIVVDIDERMLYLVQPEGKAIRYGVGVGRQGFSWRASRRWAARACGRPGRPPRPWSASSPNCRATCEAGLDNPLGARALYLHQNGADTLFRIHGTNEPWSIGEQVSSGCVRMLNEDVADLYERVPVGTTVYVKRNGRYRV